MRIKNFKCNQCGAADFDKQSDDRFRCAYCHSLYKAEDRTKTKPHGSGVFIKKGAKVSFNNVTFFGKVEIEEGAEVEFKGKIKLLEKAPKQQIEQAKEKLKKEKK